MFKGMKGTVVALAMALTFSMLAGCASTQPTNLDLGTLTEGRFYDRTIQIVANTKFVNVDAGEVIRFVVREADGTDQSFTWHFNIGHMAVEDLSRFAPAGVLDRPVQVVVGPDPRY